MPRQPSDSAALTCAVQSERVDCLRVLLDNEASINTSSYNGHSPLILSAIKGQAKVMRMLLSGGADVDAVDPYGWRALMNAVCAGNKEKVQLLIEAGRDVHHQNYLGCTALFIATQTGRPEIAQLLKAAGAANRIDKPLATILRCASMHFQRQRTPPALAFPPALL